MRATETMEGGFLLRSAFAGLVFISLFLEAAEWPQWRGPNSNGVSSESGLPVKWSETDNLAWVCPLPGTGNSSPIAWGDRVFLTAENRGRLITVAIDSMKGQLVWQKSIEPKKLGRTHGWNGHASSTPATDGERVYVFFGDSGVHAYDFSGNRVWSVPLNGLDCVWGIASSPVLSHGALYLSVDHDKGSFVMALDARTGQVRWRTERGITRGFSSPVVAQAGTVEEIIINGNRRVTSYDAKTGKELWRCLGMTQWVTPTVVAGDGLVYATSGRNGPALAIRPGGRSDVTRSHVEWRVRRGAPYIPSPLLYQGLFYMMNDSGIVTCIEAKTGKAVYQSRLGSRGQHTASPVAGDGKLYFMSENGLCTVVRAGRRFQILAQNQLKGLFRASPAISGGRLYLRSQDKLYCIRRK